MNQGPMPTQSPKGSQIIRPCDANNTDPLTCGETGDRVKPP